MTPQLVIEHSEDVYGDQHQQDIEGKLVHHPHRIPEGRVCGVVQWA